MSMISKTIKWGGAELTLETGHMARMANGAVMVKFGQTCVLCTVAIAKEAKEDQGFFPLSVHYVEKAYAAGKIPGGFFKRESKPSDFEVLTSRLIDRPIRPLFHEFFMNETQVICTVLSYDGVHSTDIAAMIGASAAITLSGAPFDGPIAGARVGCIDDEFVLNPTKEKMEESTLDLIIAGTAQGVLMVESEAHELSEDRMLEAVTFGHDACQPVIKLINDLKEECNVEAWAAPAAPEGLFNLMDALQKDFSKDIEAAYDIPTKRERYEKLDAIKAEAQEKLAADDETAVLFTKAFKKVEHKIVRHKVLHHKGRIDGRKFDEVRPISSTVGLLPRVHGSALFQRGETQALGVTTLGTSDDEQMTDSLTTGESKEHFLLHYNFPPYSVGETGRMGPPGRREVGHGKLAWRALNPLMPKKEDFPYTVRVVADILECNGSSSMATVCASSLSMMDAGVPLRSPVSGIAMGLVTNHDATEYAILSDIMADEDFLGDMDFKVTGSENGITALQMDIKITSITQDIMKEALAQAKQGRLHILGEMKSTIDTHRQEISDHAPKIASFKINKDKIGEIIGPGGKVIKEICEKTNTKVDIIPEGEVRIFATPEGNLDEAVAWIKSIAVDPEVGEVFESAKVVKVIEHGAFVNYMRNRDGFVHISEIAKERVNNVSDHLKEGDTVNVKLVGVDDRGRVRLSIKALL